MRIFFTTTFALSLLFGYVAGAQDDPRPKLVLEPEATVPIPPPREDAPDVPPPPGAAAARAAAQGVPLGKVEQGTPPADLPPTPPVPAAPAAGDAPVVTDANAPADGKVLDPQTNENVE